MERFIEDVLTKLLNFTEGDELFLVRNAFNPHFGSRSPRELYFKLNKLFKYLLFEKFKLNTDSIH